MTIPLELPITEIPIACDLTDKAFADRRQTILASLWQKMDERQELADGYAFRFPGTNEMAQEVVDFALAERQCCAFFQIEISFSPEKGSIWLRLRGGDGVKQFIETALAET
ncbi:MAG: hypothetical protein DHS20C20_12470 [Ardenticatenaceae bacterium]|nr:MAG: hypothetical protein DHS20C20_12470 [Ardenticatenaceae bacterium]